MKQQLQSLSTLLRAIDLAASAEEVINALMTCLKGVLPDAKFSIKYKLADLPAPVRSAVEKTLTPQSSDDGRQIAVPMAVDGQVHGVVFITTKQEPGTAELTSVLAVCQMAANSLDRLSWHAHPRVFRQLVENANVAIDVADLGGTITYANRAAARIYGYTSPDQMVGRNISDLYFSDTEKLVATELI